MLQFFTKTHLIAISTVYEHTVWIKPELSVSFQGHSDDGEQFNKHQLQIKLHLFQLE